MRNVDRILMAAVLAAGCRQADGREVKSGDEDRTQPAGTSHVASIAGFRSPESVKYDPDQDAWFVTNIIGFGSDKDGQAYIVRIEAGNLDSMTVFARSGVKGVTLDAPKGMAIQGDTLWVADIDVLRGFNRRTGAPVGAIDLAPLGVTMLNDIALGPDGNVAHGLLRISGEMIMIEGEWPTLPSRAPAPDGTSPVIIFLYVPDVDATLDRAVANGARVLVPLQDQFWGDRIAWLVDPAGHVWTVASRIEDTTAEERSTRWSAILHDRGS